MRLLLHLAALLSLATPNADSAPGAPTALTAAVAGTSVTLSWSAPVTGGTPAAYVVEAGSSAGLANLASLNTGTIATTFGTTGVTPGTYFVRVKAINAAGTSAASNEITVVVIARVCDVPGAPSGLTLAGNTGGAISLAWTAAPGAFTGYEVQAG